jgi:hypothetical protein
LIAVKETRRSHELLLPEVLFRIRFAAAVVRGGEASFDFAVFADVEGENELGAVGRDDVVVRPGFIDLSFLEPYLGP